MKKLLVSALISVFAFSFTNAQESTFSEGDKVINLGVGLGSTLYTGSGFSTTVPPISASFEYGILNDVLEKGSVGVGGYLGYTAARARYNWFGDIYGYDYTSFIIGARGSFHYPLVEKLDTYAGMMLGYNIVSVSEIGDVSFGTSTTGSDIAWSMYLGGRYWFNPKIAGMVELGYGIAYLNLGVAFKL
ncbi:MAG: hypothetical protein L3J35_03000 [Bacteroidales bacterium]|nr:hypothetical protein [Bacteroidales bacterium]